MTKFVKIKDREGKPVILNVRLISSIQRGEDFLPEYRDCILITMDTGISYYIHEDDWHMLGIDLVQELHSGWKKDEVIVTYGTYDPESPHHVIMENLKDDVRAVFGVDMSSTLDDPRWPQTDTWSNNDHSHQFGTQQYVKDES